MSADEEGVETGGAKLARSYVGAEPDSLDAMQWSGM